MTCMKYDECWKFSNIKLPDQRFLVVESRTVQNGQYSQGQNLPDQGVSNASYTLKEWMHGSTVDEQPISNFTRKNFITQ